MITTQSAGADAGIQIVGGDGETGGIVVDDNTIQLLDPISGNIGPVSGNITCQNAVIAAQHKTPYINIEQNKIQTVSTNVDLEIDPSGTGTVDFILPTSATVGANGAASALTANPVGYLKIKVNGTEYQLPYYNI
jgi:hypothetical protein